ncbi:uncharacterized protein LOC121593429 [Anopheles merus]|uniref:uncharacterized protein LOC121593426 n=1 Tax=Anopheles merus TaxID=30066 RepID=UPI001BE43C5A|nr:uncharacterized protein LOC121593426 [Anopheles merus]XP_041771692.1 uncharacterized protein LOC121593427 [Anopheles merus]XP_041771693.1 uncharacterized protein LOC121593428 [Anopheles merus]XP_041771695.1 uncharacterized protein LOC121593429 [Anopheles merus]
MKFTFAFVLIALFAVFTVSQALPQPDEVAAASTTNTDEASANTQLVLELTPEEAAAVEAMGGRGFWKKLWKGVKTAITVGCKLTNCM